ncbi:MAG TPA: choice-of-anchor Q domain-containing protein, partial [Pyrinomonadaceae bacterium]|nr:choice-of-anchor Q domain-containing protein [Pyrinomonadaceae bacterium]
TGPDISGPVTSQGFNLIKSTTGATTTGITSNNITGQDPVLSPLANNGGSVQTHMLLPGSPALDAADPANFPTTDARGNSRPIDGDGNGTSVPDIGAFERRPGILQFSSSTFSAPENVAGGAATITVTRTNGTDGSVSIQYGTSDGTATAGTDYQSANGTLTLANGVASSTFSVPITNDTLFEPDETVNLMVVNPLGGATLGNPALAVLTITNDDPQPMPATVNGRVTGPDGRALRNVTIIMTDSLGVTRTATASSFGLFTFTDVPAGQTYTFRVVSRLFRFANTSVQINGDMTLPDLVGLE